MILDLKGEKRVHCHFRGIEIAPCPADVRFVVAFFVSNPHGKVRFKKRKRGSLSFSGMEITPCPADGGFAVAFVVAFVVGYLQGTVGFTG